MKIEYKAVVILLLILTLAFNLSGCKKVPANNKVVEDIAASQDAENNNDKMSEVEKDIEAKRKEMSKKDKKTKGEKKAKAKNKASKENAYAEDEINNDLTKLSTTMVFSELYNILAEAESNFGSIIRIKGKFDYYKDEESGKMYYGVFVTDATACCQQGLEFQPKEHYKFPDDYPKKGTWMTVTGEFQAYEDGGLKYCHLINADFSVSEKD